MTDGGHSTSTAPPKQPKRARPARERTCVGCGRHDDASALVRLVVEDDAVAFDLAGGAFGRGAHVHARPECLAKAPRGIARSFHRPPVSPADLGSALVAACDRSMAGLFITARRLGALAVGADAALGAMAHASTAATGAAPLLVVAVDAGAIAGKHEVQSAVAAGRAISWKTKGELGGLIGEGEVALCAVRHEAIAAKLKDMRAAADAGASVGAGQHVRGSASACSTPGRHVRGSASSRSETEE